MLLTRIARKRSEPWGEFAREMGLTFNRGGALRSHSVRGTYRGRQVHEAKLTVGFGDDPERADGLSLHVENSGKFELSIQPWPWIFRAIGAYHPATAKQPLKGSFNLAGSPQQYLDRAIDLIESCDPRLLATLMTHPPHIQLKGSRLVFVPADPTQMNDTITILNLSCDLVELAEQMGGQSPAVAGDTHRGQATH